jgi:Ca2+-binding RTX toxin-like protein
MPITSAGHDKIDGNGGNDLVFGDNTNFEGTAGTAGGNDLLNGGTGDDALSAGPANDKLDGGVGTDDCNGEGGADQFDRCETVTDA